MRTAGKLKNLKENRKLVFNLIKEYIEKYEDVGYLIFNSENDNSIDIKVGDDKYTIAGELFLNSNQILFKVSYWKFDLKNKDRFIPIEIDQLAFYTINNRLVKLLEDKKTLGFIMANAESFVENLLDNFDNYTEKRQEPEVVKMHIDNFA